MYQEHFHLKQEPFSIAPDPSFLYLSSAHREALAHLMYGFSHGGFVLITGEVGTGKTTLLRNLLKQTPPDLDVAFILNPRLTVRELLETLCDELGVSYDPDSTQTVKQFIDALNRHLLATHRTGRSTVVIIDEAQNLSPAVLEQIRLLTNLETDEKKLLRIILLGQPELAELLARQELRQLAQRITARYHLAGLNRQDSYAYVIHRLSRAGGNPHIFTRGALRRLYRLAKGIPRIINVIADRALLGAYVEDRQRVSAAVVSRAADEVLGRRPRLRTWAATAAVGIGLAGIATAYFLPNPLPGTPPTVDPVAALVQPAASSIAALVPGEAPETAPQGTASRLTVLQSPLPTTREAPLTANESPNETSATLRTQPAVSDLAGAITNADPQADLIIRPRTAAGELVQQRPSNSAIARPAGTTYATQRQAYAEVFERWGADYLQTPEELIPCDFAPSAGLQCLMRHGSWSDIRQLNLPVILELWDDETGPYYGALVRAQADALTLQIGNTPVTTTPRGLRDAWYGTYVVLWQTPPGYRGSLRQGDSHQTVGWLRAQLAALDAQSLATDEPEFFGAGLHDTVIEFQLQEGLLTDGIVGPATWIRLADRLNLPAPKLDS